MPCGMGEYCVLCVRSSAKEQCCVAAFTVQNGLWLFSMMCQRCLLMAASQRCTSRHYWQVFLTHIHACAARKTIALLHQMSNIVRLTILPALQCICSLLLPPVTS